MLLNPNPIPNLNPNLNPNPNPNPNPDPTCTRIRGGLESVRCTRFRGDAHHMLDVLLTATQQLCAAVALRPYAFAAPDVGRERRVGQDAVQVGRGQLRRAHRYRILVEGGLRLDHQLADAPHVARCEGLSK